MNLENCRAKKKTIIFTDSIPKGIRMREFNYFIKNSTAQMKCFPGATSKDLNYYVIPTLQNNSYDQVLIHVGINDLLNSDKPDHQSLSQNIMSVIQKCKDSGIAEIIISSLVVTEKNQRQSDYRSKRITTKFLSTKWIQFHRQQKYSSYKVV